MTSLIPMHCSTTRANTHLQEGGAMLMLTNDADFAVAAESSCVRFRIASE